MLKHFPQFAANELLVREALGMVEFAVECGYFDKQHDLDWSRRLIATDGPARRGAAKPNREAPHPLPKSP
jgi:hypothetical protein